jgi:putative ABC transport system permease protein
MIALTLLVCGMVFAAVAGPAESLHTRSQALSQTIAGLAPAIRVVQATISLPTMTSEISGGDGQLATVSAAELGQAKQQLSAGISSGGVPLSGGDFTSVATSPAQMLSSGYAPRAVIAGPPRLAFQYRDTLASHVRLVAGSLTPGPGFPAGALAVSTTPQIAYRYGLRPGSRMVVDGNLIVVTGIVAPQEPGGLFWQYDVTTMEPGRVSLHAPGNPEHWAATVLVDPGQLPALSATFGDLANVTWVYPVSPGNVNADQLQGLYNRLNAVSALHPALTGQLQFATDDIVLSTPLTTPLLAFLQTQAAVLAVLLLLFVSLGAIGVAVIFLAARMIVEHRHDELIMLRARGASVRQAGLTLARSAALATVPAAVVGAAAAVAVVPGAGRAAGGSATLSWVLACIVTVVAVTAPAVLASWRHRQPAPAANPAQVMTADITPRRFSARALRRVVAELTAAGATIAGLAILRGQGVSGGASTGTNWFLTLAPVLVAVPAVVITLRLYPLIVRAALRFARPRAGATSYVALAASARTSLAAAGPVFALVLALTLAAFSAMMTQSISTAQSTASWQATGADALLTGNGGATTTSAVVERSVATIRGVQHAAAVWTTDWTAPGGQSVTVLAIDPAQYAALTAGTPFPAMPAGALTPSPHPVTTATTIGALASPAAAAALGGGTSQLVSLGVVGPIKVHVTGTLSATPAVPSGGGAWILIPMQTLPGQAGTPAPGTVLVTGADIDRNQLAAFGSRAGFSTVYRADVLASLTRSPLPHGAVALMLLTALAAAALALLNLILGLALGAAERDLTLARLTVMGVRYGSRLALTETIPAIVAAILASLACALALPALIGNTLNLSVFTTSELATSATAVTLNPDIVSIGLPAAILLVLTIATLAIQTRANRRRGPSRMLRAT